MLRRLITQWNTVLADRNDMKAAVTHPLYREIHQRDVFINIGDGFIVHRVPYELMLKMRKDQWNAGFIIMLEEILGVFPYQDNEHPIQSWLRWGREQHYIFSEHDVMTQALISCSVEHREVLTWTNIL